MREKGDKIWKYNRKTSLKDKWEYFDVIIILPLLEVNRRLPLLHMSKNIVHVNTIEECINQFSIGYIINPTLHVDKVFRDQVGKFPKINISSRWHERYIIFMRKKDTCIIPLVMFYETKKPTKVYRVLSCVLYSIIDNYVLVYYPCCHYKILSFISYDKVSG